MNILLYMTQLERGRRVRISLADNGRLGWMATLLFATLVALVRHDGFLARELLDATARIPWVWRFVHLGLRRGPSFN